MYFTHFYGGNLLNILIRLLQEQDAKDVLHLEVRNKEFFQSYTPLRSDSFYTIEGQLDKINNTIKNANNGIGYSFGIFLKGSQRLIGIVTLTEVVKSVFQSCWLGYYLDQEENGKGYMTEAVKLAVDFAFKECNLHRIEAGVMPHNIGSIRVLEKAGFHKEGIARGNVKINGKWEDHQILAIINESYVEE